MCIVILSYIVCLMSIFLGVDELSYDKGIDHIMSIVSAYFMLLRIDDLY